MGKFLSLRVCLCRESDERSELENAHITKVKSIYYVLLCECACIIAAALAALPLSPEIRVHPQQNLSFETNILQPLIEWIVVPSTSAEDSLLEGI